MSLVVMMLEVDGGFNKFHSDVYSRMMNERKESRKVQGFVRDLFNSVGSIARRFCVL